MSLSWPCLFLVFFIYAWTYGSILSSIQLIVRTIRRVILRRPTCVSMHKSLGLGKRTKLMIAMVIMHQFKFLLSSYLVDLKTFNPQSNYCKTTLSFEVMMAMVIAQIQTCRWFPISMLNQFDQKCMQANQWFTYAS